MATAWAADVEGPLAHSDASPVMRFTAAGIVRRDLHVWAPLDAADPLPVDVAAAYAEQDKYLPAQYRIEWQAAA